MRVGRKAADTADREDVKAKGARKTGAAKKGKVAAQSRADSPTRSRRSTDTAARGGRARGTGSARRPHEPRGLKQGPQTAPAPRPAERQARPKNASQAKARAKARKAKAPKVVRPPLRDRLIARLATVDLRPQTLMAKVPFVVLVIGSLGVGLATTLWLSTDAAQRSYQLSNARATNQALSQQKEALERDVLEAESAPALAEAARNLGMIPSKDTAHLVQDPSGNWVVVGKPKPAEGVPPPPLNNKLPDDKPVPPPPPAAPQPKPGSLPEVPVRLVPLNTQPLPGAVPLAGLPPAADPEVAVRAPSPADHAPAVTTPGPAPLPGPTTDMPPALVAPPADVPPAAAPAVAPVPAPAPAVAPVPAPAPAVPLAGAAQ
ncbi:hypothetical protein [Mycolicibacterium sp. CH28]|uniref:hypothetical protein n=1 Tax=Mycolicibacterium sp. CH28 TaxID=2512237 RepID=UPI0019146EEC|nr:hypothetical protein [Mycolicibacterium sp. CH28]